MLELIGNAALLGVLTWWVVGRGYLLLLTSGCDGRQTRVEGGRSSAAQAHEP